jgi:hypothetical protein
MDQTNAQSRFDKKPPYIFGHGKDGRPLEWRLLAFDENEDKALIMTENIVGQRPYHNEQKSVTWDKCSLRAYLNGEGEFEGKGFINEAFSEDELNRRKTRTPKTDTGHTTAKTL